MIEASARLPLGGRPKPRSGFGWGWIALWLFALACAAPAHARLDLSHASVERLDNGLTLILLEDRTFPVVSLHTTYKTGGKDDPAGRLGLAHFFEHMAFRGSKNFPDTGLVSEIYAAGGEWHGYTWIDTTNYFATVPKGDLPLLLDIEADRMARLDLRKDEVEAERGAVIAEMNSYLNDPDSTLFDALMAAHFLTHPYRNNTIGYAADVNAIRHADLAVFYERHYAPANAVITVVGDFQRDEVRKAVAKRFGKIEKQAPPRDPLTAEIPRTGERRIRLSLPSEQKLFKIAYPAPAASSDDLPAFLVLEALIGKSIGVNFHQDDWGTPVGESSPLARAAANVRTWIIPTAEPYAFVVSGSASEKADEAKVERAIQKAFDAIAAGKFDERALAAAKTEVAEALLFDVDTTEEAAHQLAYFAGVGAFDQLLTLDADVRSVAAERVAAVAKRYLAADQRTIAWLEPGPAVQQPAASAPTSAPEARAGSLAPSAPMPSPDAFKTDNGVAVFFQRSELSQTVAVTALLAGRFECDACSVDELAFGTTTVSTAATSDTAQSAFDDLTGAIASAKPKADTPSDDPMSRLEETFASFSLSAGLRTPQVIAVSGNIDAETVARLSKNAFAPTAGAAANDFGALLFKEPSGDIDIMIDKPKAQAAVGYIASAPAPGDSLPVRIALYVLSHGYEGRLGKEAISRRGLLYYIDAQYRGGPDAGFVTLAAGVDPDKLDAFRALMKSEIARLASEPPSDEEIAEAKRHLMGRKISAAQSNEEIAGALIRDWLALRAPESPEALRKRLDAVSREDVLEAIEVMTKGSVVAVRVKSAK